MRALFVTVVLLALVAVGVDYGVATLAENGTEQDVSVTLDAPATVEFHGWPVGLRILTGTIPRVEVSATDVPLARGASLDRLDVELTDVEVRISDLTGEASDRLPPARDGTFEAKIDESSVAAMLGLPRRVVALDLAGGVATLSAAGLRVDAEVTARDGDVLVALQGALVRLLGGAEFRVDLSDEPGSPAVEDVEIRDGVMVLRGRLEEVDR